jgi:sugar phosphate isomerase/epimerase
MTRPKLSISTLGCPNWDFIKTLQEFNKLGIDAMEVRGVDGQMDADKILRFKPENQAETKRLLKQYNVKMIGFGSSASFHNPDNVEQMIESTKREIDICSQMDIPAIRVFGNDIPDPKKQDQTVKQVTEALGQVAHYAAQKGMIVNLEIHGGFNTRETVEPIVQELKGRTGIRNHLGHQPLGQNVQGQLQAVLRHHQAMPEAYAYQGLHQKRQRKVDTDTDRRRRHPHQANHATPQKRGI